MGREVAEGLGLVPRDVVTAFIRYQGKVLLLRRSERVGSYPGRWAAVSGYLERDSALAQALVEIDEETGIPADSLDLVREGAPLGVPAPRRGHPVRRTLRSDGDHPHRRGPPLTWP